MNDSALQFLSALFGSYTDPSFRCELRALPRPTNEGERPQRAWYQTGGEAITAAARASIGHAPLWNVYCGVLPRIGRTGGTNDVGAAGWLYADIDGGNMGPEGSRELLNRCDLPEPHMIVRSGGGLHVYWQLSSVATFGSAEDRYQFKQILRRIVLRIGGTSPGPHADPSAAEPARILRIPGTLNHKTDPPKSVDLLAFDVDASSYPLAEWNANLPLLPRPKTFDAPITVSGMVTTGLKRWAETGYPEGKRHMDLAAAAAWLVRDCKLSKSDAEELLRIKAARSSGTRSITLEEIRSIVQWV